MKYSLLVCKSFKRLSFKNNLAFEHVNGFIHVNFAGSETDKDELRCLITNSLWVDNRKKIILFVVCIVGEQKQIMALFA